MGGDDANDGCRACGPIRSRYRRGSGDDLVEVDKVLVADATLTRPHGSLALRRHANLAYVL